MWDNVCGRWTDCSWSVVPSSEISGIFDVTLSSIESQYSLFQSLLSFPLDDAFSALNEQAHTLLLQRWVYPLTHWLFLLSSLETWKLLVFILSIEYDSDWLIQEALLVIAAGNVWELTALHDSTSRNDRHVSLTQSRASNGEWAGQVKA